MRKFIFELFISLLVLAMNWNFNIGVKVLLFVSTDVEILKLKQLIVVAEYKVT